MERKLQQAKGNGFILKTVPFCAEGKASALRGGHGLPAFTLTLTLTVTLTLTLTVTLSFTFTFTLT